ncbi:MULTISPECIES: hypothetical protein [unclassified Mesorhizobium]|uniref:hypothetical protein n=1 Tax=unclassified Mesorhizobium TaxID=325217 RepID=UPI0015CA3221|nr:MULTISPECIES: hypothetical protein [unclassified Mesorhizobium]
MRKTRRFGDTAGDWSSVEIGVNPAANYRCRIMHRKELSRKLSQGARSRELKLAGARSSNAFHQLHAEDLSKSIGKLSKVWIS